MEKYFSRFGGKMGVRLFLTPFRNTVNARHKELLGRAIISHVNVNGCKVVVRKWGAGPEIIMVHGWSKNGFSFANFVDEIIPQGYSIVLPDMVGHGESEGEKSSAFAFRNTIIQLLKEYPKCWALVGHSLGGLGCIMALNLHPQNVKKLVTIGMPVYLDQVLNHFTSQIGAGPQIKKRIWQMLNQQFGNEQQPFSAFELVDDLPKSIQYSIVHDVKDDEVPFHNAEELSQKCNATLVKTIDLGHGGALRDAQTIERIIAFLKQ